MERAVHNRSAMGAAWCVAAICAVLLSWAPTAAASTTRQSILGFAQQEIGYHDHGYYCTKFGPCETWCSLFVSWVWRQAGVPVPSLAFTGYLYDWSRESTYVLGPHAVPQPGDAVLFGTGPWTVNTSLHTGIVEAVYPGYLVTIEGDSWHGVRRYVVPLRNPQLVGEPGPIYGYASPVRAAGSHALAASAAVSAFPALPRAMLLHQDVAHRQPSEQQRLLSAIAALRAFQHMPYRTANVLINWTGVNPQGLVEVTVTSSQPMSVAVAAWHSFLRRFDDAGRSYAVSFDVAPDVPVDTSLPTISGTAEQGQTLTETHGAWSNSPTSYTYQWETCDVSGEACSSIQGETAPTYTAGPGDVGRTIRVQETASNGAGAGQSALSVPTAVVAPGPPPPPPPGDY